MSSTTLGPLYTLALAGFVNPSYLGPNDPVNDPTGSRGFDIRSAKAVAISFPGSGYTVTLTHEQTMDPTGQSGWFPVVGRIVTSIAAPLTSNGSSSVNSYLFPAIGIRHRMRVVALTVADITARIAMLRDTIDLSTGAVSGLVGEDAVGSTTNPVIIGYEARNTQKAGMSATGDAVRGVSTMDGKAIVVADAIPELNWQSVAGAAGIVSSTADVVLKSAAGAGIRNYIRSLDIAHDLLGGVTEFVVKDGSTIIFRGKLQTPASDGRQIVFDPPLKSTANAALNFALLTSVTGGVYVNAQGFTGL